MRFFRCWFASLADFDDLWPGSESWLFLTAPKRSSFDTASKPGRAEFAAIAKMAAGVDTLEGFLHEMKARFPDAVAKAMLPAETAKPTTD